MDRDALKHWLESPHRTWRWNHGARDAYRGVETSDAGLRWFRWSHLFGEGQDGLHAEAHQSWESFDRDGPLEALPDDVRAELEAWVERVRR